jgi:molybdopterin-guanine dinucleotide biosynthesis protein
MQQPAEQKVITISGLYSGIGKTELCCSIVSLLPGCAAIKVTINDQVTELLDDQASIMVAGKDTWRLKTSGAAQVVWLRAQEEHLKEALAVALKRVGSNPRLLIEGNSVLAHITPTVAVFMCDKRICTDKPLKPSRAAALAKADIIIHNMRTGIDAAEAAVTETVGQYNPTARVATLDVTDKRQAAAFLTGLLQTYGFLPVPCLL